MSGMDGGAKGLFQETMAGCRQALLHVGVFSLAINLLMLVPSLYMLQLFDRVLQTRSYDTLLYLTLIAVAALAVLGLLDMIRARMLVRISTWIDRRLAGNTFERAIVAGLRGSPYQRRALQDLLELRSAMGSATLVSVFDAPWVPIYLLVIWLLHPMMALVAAVGAVVLFAPGPAQRAADPAAAECRRRECLPQSAPGPGDDAQRRGGRGHGHGAQRRRPLAQGQ